MTIVTHAWNHAVHTVRLILHERGQQEASDYAQFYERTTGFNAAKLLAEAKEPLRGGK